MLSGKRALVEDARKRVVQMLQMQATNEIRVPKEHHRVIIGQFMNHDMYLLLQAAKQP